jgi:hypothetical protein
MNEVINLIEQKISDIDNFSITTQEEESMMIYELTCLHKLQRLCEQLKENCPI